MIELAQSVAEGHLDLEGLAALPDDEAVKRLCELRGVGRWTAEYVLLRGLGRTHIFPGRRRGRPQQPSALAASDQAARLPGVSRVLSRWDGYAGLVYFHLLLDRLAEAGHLGGTGPAGPEASWPQGAGRCRSLTAPRNGRTRPTVCTSILEGALKWQSHMRNPAR